MDWQMSIMDPSGETRIYPLTAEAQHVQLGRHAGSDILLRDPTAPNIAAFLTTHPSGSEKNTIHSETQSPYWISAVEPAPPIYLSDLRVRYAQVPVQAPIRIGETLLQISKKQAESRDPAFPSGVKPWHTNSAAGRKLLWTAKKTAETPLSIYLEGETGTGKEVLAHLLHAWSPRRSGPFIPLHCGALALSLIESELFGHVKGAFTGAESNRPGALLQAHGGTLFLDEVGDLPLDIQVKLLRFLENGEIRAVGSDRTSRADARLICATHHPLQKLVSEGKFRQDLYYRIASVTISIPPLRSRPEDIECLSRQFASHLGKTLSPQALLRLQAHPWPGNVRELRHAIERASGLSSPFESMLKEEAFEFLLQSQLLSSSGPGDLSPPILSLKEMERYALLKALKISHGNRAKAAKLLGVARSTLFEMIKRHRICGPRSSFLPTETT